MSVNLGARPDVHSTLGLDEARISVVGKGYKCIPKGTGRLLAPDHRDGLFRLAAVRDQLVKPAGLSDSRTYRNWNIDHVRLPVDQGPTPRCFPEGTLIRCPDYSLVPIEQVRPRMPIVTAEGRVSRVSAVMVREHSGTLIKVKLRGHHGLRGTPEHPVLTRKGYRPLSQLRVGDELAVTRILPTEVEAEIRFADYVRKEEYARRGDISRTSYLGGVATVVTAPPETLKMTAKLGRLLGLYAAEGYTRIRDGVRWCFGSHEAETLVPETVALIREVLGAEARVQVRPNNCIIVVLGGKHWGLFFKKIAGTGAGEKAFGPGVLCGSREFLESVLMGWIDGDGHSRRHETMGVTVSHKLAVQMHAIANDLGLCPIIRRSPPSKNRHAGTRRERWEVAWQDGKAKLGYAKKIEDAAMWRKVCSIEEENFSGDVFNLEVDGDHSYVAEGLGVHNCVGYSIATAAVVGPITQRLALGTTERAQAFADEIYIAALDLDEWEGNDPNNGTSVRAGMKAAVKAGLIKGFAWGEGLKDTIDFVLNFGPVVNGTIWPDSMMEIDAHGYLNIDPDSTLDGAHAAGHAWAIVGVNTQTRNPDGSRGRFTMLQSWGRGWGRDGKGIAYMSFPTWSQLHMAGGEVCLPTEQVLRPATETAMAADAA